MQSPIASLGTPGLWLSLVLAWVAMTACGDDTNLVGDQLNGGANQGGGGQAGSGGSGGYVCDGYPSSCVALCEGGLCECYCESGGSGGAAGSENGGAAQGGTGGVCSDIPLTSCNWCNGDPLFDSNGCLAGWICQNGIDPCQGADCLSESDCQSDEICASDFLCWPADGTVLDVAQYAEAIAAPCTTDPCLPASIGAIINAGETYYLLVNGHRITSVSDWADWTGDYVPADGDQVIASGRVIYHADLLGQKYLDLELSAVSAAW